MAEEITKPIEAETQTEETPKPAPEPKVKEQKTELDAQAQIQNLMTELAKLKRATDKATAEASDYKKKWRESMSEQERASVEKAEKEAEREEQFQALVRENHINKLEKSYLAMGYTAEEASKMAVAEADGDFDAKLRIMTQVDDRKKKEYEAEWLKSRPSVNAGVGGEKPDITKEQFDKLGYRQLVEFKAKFPETYKSYVGKN